VVHKKKLMIKSEGRKKKKKKFERYQ